MNATRRTLRSRTDGVAIVLFGVLTTFLASGAVFGADVTRPGEVSGLLLGRSGTDVQLVWNAVTLDAAGQPETIDHYKVYRGVIPTFSPDTSGGSNLIGNPPLTQFDDPGAVVAPDALYFYLLSAVDGSANESGTRPPRVSTPGALSGFWTDTTIELQWAPFQPASEVVAYRVYHGRTPHQYEAVTEVGGTSHSLFGLQTFVNWYSAITAVDTYGNESPFSNEHVDAIAGRVRVRAQDEDYLCWTDADTCPARPGVIKRGGWQALVPVSFPEGDWTRVLVTYTMDSRLCEPPAQGTTTRCGDTNPGGYNPCGDPWDRIAQLFLVLDDCIDTGGSCITQNNLELMRAITPFGTDADPPDGRGIVGPRALTLDVTPFAPLLAGTRYVGAEIVNFTQAGWYVTVDFEFSERPDETSPKPPADGFQVVGLGGAPLPARPVTIPPAASQVKMRLFTTGHGGSLHCEGGSNQGAPCTSSVQCPGGACVPCDEFCQKKNRVLKDGLLVWQAIPWRTDCSPGGNPCSNWNSCGFPSCTFSRSGWCPGYIACHQNPPCDQDIDMTAFFPPGGTYNVEFRVLNQQGSWPASLVFYWYE